MVEASPALCQLTEPRLDDVEEGIRVYLLCCISTISSDVRHMLPLFCALLFGVYRFSFCTSALRADLLPQPVSFVFFAPTTPSASVLHSSGVCCWSSA